MYATVTTRFQVAKKKRRAAAKEPIDTIFVLFYFN